jgi:hypothetical protein
MLVIGQLQYATTSRYNFPSSLQEMELPKRLTEISLSTMQTAKGKPFQPCETEFLEPLTKETHENEAFNLNCKALSTFLTPLTPIRDETPIIAIDVSGIKIGETETGILCAVRGAIVWDQNRHYRYLRLGPFPFHITEENKRGLLTKLGKYSGLTLNSQFYPLAESVGKMCSSMERWIQTSLSYTAEESIILWDGSLTTGIAGNPAGDVSHILKVARRRGNNVLAFSKATTIRFLRWRITDLVAGHKAPCLFEVSELPLSVSSNILLLGRIYVAKLASGSSAFRLDIDKSLVKEGDVVSVEKLMGNDLVYQGYPESLRLAHIYSTFTANDVIGVQSFLTHEYRLRIVTRHNMRKALFGPYGTGYED